MTNSAAAVSLDWTLGGVLQSETTHYTVGAGVADQTVVYGFNGAGQPTSIAGQGSLTSFGYDVQGRLSGVVDTVAGVFGYGYDSVTGQIASLTRPNGITDHFSFDASARLTARNAFDAAGSVVNKAEYGYSPAGLRDSLSDVAGIHNYSYDVDGRLTGVDNPVGGVLVDEVFGYDSVGNRTLWNDNPASQVRYNQADQLTQDAAFMYSYDAEGNLASERDRVSGAVTRYVWDAAHQLREITGSDGDVRSYAYDPLGRRISTTDFSGTSFWVWAGANLRATLDVTGNVTSRLVTNPSRLSDTLGVTTPVGTSYPLVDGLGSTTATTDSAGVVTSRTAYSAYGTPTAVLGVDPTAAFAGFTGYQQDPTGLDYARARYYNPTTATFLSQDPILASNPYFYADSNPTNFTDRTGTMAFTEESMLQGVVGWMTGLMGGMPGCIDKPTLQEFMVCEGANAAFGAATGVQGELIGYSKPLERVAANSVGPIMGCMLMGSAGLLAGYGWNAIGRTEDPSSVESKFAFLFGCGTGIVRGM